MPLERSPWSNTRVLNWLFSSTENKNKTSRFQCFWRHEEAECKTKLIWLYKHLNSSYCVHSFYVIHLGRNYLALTIDVQWRGFRYHPSPWGFHEINSGMLNLPVAVRSSHRDVLIDNCLSIDPANMSTENSGKSLRLNIFFRDLCFILRVFDFYSCIFSCFGVWINIV